MTSPQAVAADAAPATISAPQVHDAINPNLNDLTAVGNTEDALQNQQNENGTVTANRNTAEDLQNQPNGNGMQLTNFNASEAQQSLTNLDNGDLLPPHDLAFTSAYPLESVAAYYDPSNPMNPMASSLDLLAGLAGNSALGSASNDMFPRMPMGMALQPAPDFLNLNADYAIPGADEEEDTEHEVTAFAKLDFPDGSVYITTYTITLGRDQYAFLEAKKRERQEARLARQLSLGDPQTPQRIRQNGSYYRPPRSVMSDAGGILRLGDDDAEEIRNKNLSKNSRAGSVTSGHVAGNQGGARYQDPRFEAFSRMNGQAEFAEDANTHRPRRTEKPLLMIHPGALAEFKYHKKISREHLKIAWHSRNRLWEGLVLGRNGVFLDDVFYPKGAVMTLTSGCVMQISNLDITFSIPGVPHGETGAEVEDDEDDSYPTTYSEGGKAMSFDFEDRPREGATVTDYDEESEDEPFRTIEEDDRDQILEEYEHENENENEGSVEAIEEVIEDESDGEDESPSIDGRNDQSGQDEQQFSMPPEPIQMQPQEMQPPPKKRGPGRPPKDGIMSKREKQEAKKAAMAQAEGLAAQKNVLDAPAVPTKNKVGRPRKHPIPEPTEEVRPKRKYTKRRPKEPKEGEVKQEGEGGEAEQATSAKKEKPEREERSPSPTWEWDTLTPEQLAKPSANYVQLIYDVLVNSDKGPTLSLPQIYRRMQRKYPYFCHANTTVGWQSSVRHNLSQHEAFEKVEREGKGYRWGLKEGATIEKEKKRSNPPPPQQHPGHMGHQPIYSHPYQMMPGHPYPPPPPHMRGPPPGWYPPPQQGQYPPGQYPYMGPPPHMQHYPGSHLPPGLPASMPPQLAAPNAPGSYSSPYAPKPAAASEGLSNEQRPLPAESTTNHTQPHGHTSQPSLPQTEQLQAPPAPQNSFQPQTSQAYQSPLPAQSVPVPELNQPPRPKPNEATLKTVAAFKSTMTGSQTSQPNLPAIVDSAISQVLCYTNQSVLAEVHQGREKQIMGALRELLGKIPGTNLAELQPPTAATLSNQNGTQAGAPSQSHQLQSSTPAGPDKIVRPQFNGHGHGSHSRPNIPIPRPGFMSGNMPRNNSGSPAMTPARTMPHSASPAPSLGGVNGASTSNVPVGENANLYGLGQLAGQKRDFDEAALGESEMGDSKRLSTTGSPQVKA